MAIGAVTHATPIAGISWGPWSITRARLIDYTNING